MNEISGFGPAFKVVSSTNRWTGDFATGRIYGPTDAHEPRITGFNKKDFDFILEAINKALNKQKKTKKKNEDLNR